MPQSKGCGLCVRGFRQVLRRLEEKMIFDCSSYLTDLGIQITTEGKNCSPGWINIRCPMPQCGDHSNHGGFRLSDGAFRCWRCGWHNLERVIANLEGISYSQAYRRIQQYEGIPLPAREREIIRKQLVSWPDGSGPLTRCHQDYLRNRGFDPEYLENKYQLKGTSIYGPYAYRIVIPIILDGMMVSYQARDFTNRQELRYKACRKEDEIIDHQTILYNVDNAGGRIVLVEGIFDVWRIGDGAVCCFGTSVTPGQIQMMVDRFKKIFVMFDSEGPAQDKAKDLCDYLGVLGVEARNVKLDKGDPAEMSQDDVDRIRRFL